MDSHSADQRISKRVPVEHDHRFRDGIAAKIGDSLLDYGDEHIVHLNEFQWHDPWIGHCELGLPVLPDRRPSHEHGPADHVGPPCVVNHHRK